MGFYGYIEIRKVGVIPIRDQSGLNLGNTLAAFLEAYEDYALKTIDSPCYVWFKALEDQSTTGIRVLSEIVYAGEGDLNFEGTELIWSETDQISTADFIKESTERNNWANLDLVINAVKEMIRLFSYIKEETFWFSRDETSFAFRVLLDVLNGCRHLGGQEIRICFI